MQDQTGLQPRRLATPVADSPVDSVTVGAGAPYREITELRSQNGHLRFVMQANGELQLYAGQEDEVVWAVYLDTGRIRGDVRLVLQGDGNLVALDSTSTSLWATETANRGPSPYTLTMQDDGNCVLSDGQGRLLWSTNTQGWGQAAT